MILTFEEIFHKQRILQRNMGEPLGFGNNGVLRASIAMTMEIAESLDEINWKPWKKTTKEVDRDKLVTEMADVLQFYVNAHLTMRMTHHDIGFEIETLEDLKKLYPKINYPITEWTTINAFARMFRASTKLMSHDIISVSNPSYNKVKLALMLVLSSWVELLYYLEIKPTDIDLALRKKWKINEQRIKEGY